MSNGFLDWEMDENYYSIWTFDRIEEYYAEFKQSDSEFIPICDYLINCWHYGYIKNREGIFSDCNGIVCVAKDFNEFINLIIKDADILY